jgi:hypothetical protein
VHRCAQLNQLVSWLWVRSSVEGLHSIALALVCKNWCGPKSKKKKKKKKKKKNSFCSFFVFVLVSDRNKNKENKLHN